MLTTDGRTTTSKIQEIITTKTKTWDTERTTAPRTNTEVRKEMHGICRSQMQDKMKTALNHNVKKAGTVFFGELTAEITFQEKTAGTTYSTIAITTKEKINA